MVAGAPTADCHESSYVELDQTHCSVASSAFLESVVPPFDLKDIVDRAAEAVSDSPTLLGIHCCDQSEHDLPRGHDLSSMRRRPWQLVVGLATVALAALAAACVRPAARSFHGVRTMPLRKVPFLAMHSALSTNDAFVV